MERQLDWAALIRKIQATLLMTQQDLANRCNVNQNCVSYWINMPRAPGFSSKRKLLEIAREKKINLSIYEIVSARGALAKCLERENAKELIRIFEYHRKMTRRSQVKLLRFANKLAK